LYWILNTFSIVLTALGKGIQRAFAFCLAILIYRILRFRRSLIIENLTRAFGNEKTAAEIDALGFQSTHQFITTIIEFLGSHDGSVANDVTIEGDDHVTQAMAEGKGVFILCCHMGSWEAMGGAMTKRFGPSYVVVKKVGSPGVDRFVREMRTRNRFLSIERRGKGTGSEAIRQALGRNEIVGFVMDQARPKEPKYLFFGHPAKTNTTFAAIWRKNPAPVIPAYIERVSFGKHVLRILPRLDIAATDDLDADITRLTTLFNAEVEKIVRACPGQYFWMHNRWKE
jgi:KDO2-lipid IV(A) lauroyltransferase